jgi:type I restriction enzyme, R subunit
MLFYAGRVVLHPAMGNPTLVVITDRNDLDDQLFGTFAKGSDVLRQTPVQAKNRSELRQLLQVASGGVIFTTIQKFLPEERGDTFPCLSERRNIVVIADEAHRSQYGFRGRIVRTETGAHVVAGFAQHMRDALPNASYIGFTGTPVDLEDKNTRAVFGDYISVYDIRQAVEDEATVPIYYESRLAKVAIAEDLKAALDDEFEEVTELEDDSRKEKLKSKWAALEAVAGADARVTLIAEDIVKHFETRQSQINGKAMIVCMSRRICVAMYNALVALKPDWAGVESTQEDADKTGALKVVMTGSASDTEWQPHIRSKSRLSALANRMRDPKDPLKIVIVRDMWLTGFDAPCMHTLYVDKRMQGHGLMQAIARVNRVFANKSGGLVVDYLGFADDLRQAATLYTQSRGQGELAQGLDVPANTVLEKLEVCRAIFHGFAYREFIDGVPMERLKRLPAAQEHILMDEDRKERFLQAMLELSTAYSICVTDARAKVHDTEIACLDAIKVAISKTTNAASGNSEASLDFRIQQLVSKAITTEGVIDVFEAAGLKKPDVSILSDEFLDDVRAMPQKNLAVELLRKLLANELKTRTKSNAVQYKAFSEKLDETMRRYRNRAIETIETIEELIAFAKEMKKAHRRGEALDLTEAELAFYDALETNDSAVKVLGDAVLAQIARDLAETIRNSVTIDWTVKETVRAKLRVLVRRKLKMHGYPPDKTEKAVETVLKQAELLAAEWAS